MFEVTYIFGKWLKYIGNDERYVGNGYSMWKMAEVFEKRLKYMGNDLEIWEMAKIFGKWLRYMVLALSI